MIGEMRQAMWRHPLFPARVIVLVAIGLAIGAVAAIGFHLSQRVEPVARIALAAADRSLVPPIAAARAQDVSAPLVVLDAGHGGYDPGATADGGVIEKEIALAIARRLRDRLIELGGIRVALTRHDDRFLPLAERVALAEALEADLFLSIHADSLSQGEARGANVYTLSLDASDREAGRLAQQLNAGNGGEATAFGASGDVESVLADLTRRRLALQSRAAAEVLVSALDGAVPIHAPALRSGDFVVLRSSRMPSLLFEAGYVSDPADAARLSTVQGREAIVESLAEGLLAALLAEGG